MFACLWICRFVVFEFVPLFRLVCSLVCVSVGSYEIAHLRAFGSI